MNESSWTSEGQFRWVEGHGGVHLRVFVTGTGPLVLMVHGFPESWISWRHQLPALREAGFTAAALDVRGYGGSGKPDAVEAYTMAQVGGDLAAVVAALSHDGRAVLVGHDWGGPIVQATCLLHPDVVRALASLSAAAKPFVDRRPSLLWDDVYGDDFWYQRYFHPVGVAERELEADPHRSMRVFLWAMAGGRPVGPNILVHPRPPETLLGGFPDPDPLPAWLSDEDVRYYGDSFARGGFRGPLNRYRAQDLDVEVMRPHARSLIRQPALFIAGAEDPSRWMVPGIDRFEDPVPRFADPRGIHLLPGVGHWVQQEAPAEVTARLLSFLDEVHR